MRLFLDPEDFSEMRAAAYGLISYEPSDNQLYAVVSEDRDLLGSAYMWGWGDEEVRDRLCWLLEYFARELSG